MNKQTFTSATRKLLLLSGACTLLAFGPALHAQQGPGDVPAVLPPTVEGDWVRTDTNGSGSFDGLTKTFKPAALTPEGTSYIGRNPQRGRPAEQRGAGGTVITNPKTCIFNGGQLTLEYDSEGFHAVMNKKEVVFVQERGPDRHVYLDGRQLPTAEMRTPTSSGYSVGHIQPDGTLVVETTDLTPGRVTAGGWRTASTKLEQKYIPSTDGKHLTLVLTWTDPKIYTEPHTYQYTFDRMAAGSYALETYCDATDPLWGQSIVPPPQN